MEDWSKDYIYLNAYVCWDNGFWFLFLGGLIFLYHSIAVTVKSSIWRVLLLIYSGGIMGVMMTFKFMFGGVRGVVPVGA